MPTSYRFRALIDPVALTETGHAEAFLEHDLNPLLRAQLHEFTTVFGLVGCGADGADLVISSRVVQ